MKNVLNIDAGSAIDGRGGSLSDSYVQLAASVLTELGHRVEVTRADAEHDPGQERDRILGSDVILLQTPLWCMAPPWQFKKYQDSVLHEDPADGPPRMISGDGRSRSRPELRYGSGGRCQRISYMISCTCDAPEEAFTQPWQFFEGLGIDRLLWGVHKTFEFMGMTRLETFLACDVLSHPRHEQDFARFAGHLRRHVR